MSIIQIHPAAVDDSDPERISMPEVMERLGVRRQAGAEMLLASQISFHVIRERV